MHLKYNKLKLGSLNLLLCSIEVIKNALLLKMQKNAILPSYAKNEILPLLIYWLILTGLLLTPTVVV